MMRTELLLVATFAVWVSGAPLSANQEEDPHTLIRVKRTAETLMFGNHQNPARTKKSGPVIPPESSEAIDKKAEVQTDVRPALDLDNSPDVDDEEEEGPVDDTVEKSLEDLLGGDSKEDVEENELRKEDHLMEELKEESSGDEPTEANMVDYDLPKTKYQEEFKQPNPYYMMNWLDYTRGKRSATKHRAARSAPPAVKAEDMMDMGGSPRVKVQGRVKRDLGQDLRFLFNEPEYEYPVMPKRAADYPVYEDYDEGEREYEAEPEIMPEQLTNEQLEELLKEEIAELAYKAEVEEEAYGAAPYEEGYGAAPYDEGYEGSPYQQEEEDFEEGMPYEESPYIEEEEVPDQTSLLKDYLLQKEYEGLPEDTNIDYNKRADDESYDGNYQPILYQGEPGIFIPVKRQYFASPYVGMRKRALYPYQYGADGRWGALVAEETEKRNQEEMYERLFRLAEALRGKERAEEEWEKK